MPIKVAVCQVPDILEGPAMALGWMEKFTREADEKEVALICFPECFLQGYLTSEMPARRHAIHLQSQQFEMILDQLAAYKAMIVFGLMEKDNGLLFNTAVVIQQGELLGKYRKTHLLAGESIFTAGDSYPVFEINTLKFGINICYDTQFAEASARPASQGVELILCLSNTMMSETKAKKFKDLHLPMRAERTKENNIWMLSADITGEREGRLAYGTTSAINPEGKIICQVPFFETGILIIEI